MVKYYFREERDHQMLMSVNMDHALIAENEFYLIAYLSINHAVLSRICMEEKRPTYHGIQDTLWCHKNCRIYKAKKIHLKYGKGTTCRDNLFTVIAVFSREAGKGRKRGTYLDLSYGKGTGCQDFFLP